MRILVADDDTTSRLVLKSIVSKLGHECLVANDGLNAWQLLSTQAIDVLLTDWMMPGLDGLELCRRVRNELNGRYIYIVLITGLDHPEQVLEGMGAGADDYLVKPVDPFAVETRLVAANRVTILHRQVADFRAQLERANVELLDRSLTDPLTGLANRRRMEGDLENTHARALRLGQEYGVTLFDIDYFKLYNDHYGHVAGDQVLRRVAHCFDMTVRTGETIYRYGGEEFLLLLPDCSAPAAALAAGRIRQAVTDLAIPHDVRPTAPRVVTMSGGVTCWTPQSALSVRELLEHADEALYQAKSAGRNLVHVTPTGPLTELSTVVGVLPYHG
jgi:two-component system cell cycle response regulator